MFNYYKMLKQYKLKYQTISPFFSALNNFKKIVNWTYCKLKIHNNNSLLVLKTT